MRDEPKEEISISHQEIKDNLIKNFEIDKRWN